MPATLAAVLALAALLPERAPLQAALVQPTYTQLLSAGVQQEDGNVSECDEFRRKLGRQTWALLHHASVNDNAGIVSALINHTRTHYPCDECREKFADFCASCNERRHQRVRFLVKAHMNANMHAGHGDLALTEGLELLAMDDVRLNHTLAERPAPPPPDDPVIASWIDELQRMRSIGTGTPLQTLVVWPRFTCSS